MAQNINNNSEKTIKNNIVSYREAHGTLYYISMIRCIALLMIITCHILQHYQVVLAFWLDIGVQIFICISGFLYGQRSIADVPGFYIHRLIKILPPYYLVYITAGLLQYQFRRYAFDMSDFIQGLYFRDTIYGGGHLWFVGLILVCYAITPLLDRFSHKHIKNAGSLIGFCFAGVAISVAFFGWHPAINHLAWTGCYIIGYGLGINEREQYIDHNKILIVFLTVAVISNGVQIYLDHIRKVEFSGVEEIGYSFIQNFDHLVLGIAVFLLLKAILEAATFSEKEKQVLRITDKYSYEVYLVHQFFILGAFTKLAATPSTLCNIAIALFYILIFTVLLKLVETPIVKGLEKRFS